MYHSAKFYTLQKILLKGGWGREDGRTHTTERYTKKRLPPSDFPVTYERTAQP